MTNKANRIALLAAAFLLGAAASGATQSRRRNPTTEFAGLRIHNRHAFAKAPNFAVQYGYVARPETASGSFGAALQGRNQQLQASHDDDIVAPWESAI
jgi:hypothetical protein